MDKDGIPVHYLGAELAEPIGGRRDVPMNVAVPVHRDAVPRPVPDDEEEPHDKQDDNGFNFHKSLFHFVSPLR